MGNMRKRMATAAGVAAAALSAGSVAPAGAATGWDRCPDGYLCAFTGPSGTGVMAQYKWGDANLGDANGPTGMNNNIESVWNRRSSVFVIYDAPGCDSAPNTTVDPGKRNFTGFWENRISSLRYLYSPPSGEYIC